MTAWSGPWSNIDEDHSISLYNYNSPVLQKVNDAYLAEKNTRTCGSFHFSNSNPFFIVNSDQYICCHFWMVHSQRYYCPERYLSKQSMKLPSSESPLGHFMAILDVLEFYIVQMDVSHQRWQGPENWKLKISWSFMKSITAITSSRCHHSKPNISHCKRQNFHSIKHSWLHENKTLLPLRIASGIALLSGQNTYDSSTLWVFTSWAACGHAFNTVISFWAL